ncbi:putative LRR receptor-like serine/threonine-protein kinase [Prunus yedoensis var. nudiflora]|uniref:non-specific serine/threonine protein kinase n=1 Tax=Prunus yedoensis var. nudiflora TaxID=2094558 RepID=A0A314ZWG9_PRUYE|nr:putative LRR receptor-like serine/threonine-protein kinase [Prunus yedoensis var. nudiflora]
MEERGHFLLSITFLLVLQYSSLYMAELTIGTDATQTNITTDQAALLALRSHITSDPHNILVNWSTTTSVCNWVGVTCGARHLRVASLNLSYMGFIGTIPPHLGNLSFLVALSFKNNSFHSTLPHELSYLRRLRFISFGYNNFMGSIPSWFGSFPKLQSFYLCGNNFSGSIPATIFNLSTLQVIDLSINQLSGGIPRQLGNLTMLKEIYLDRNNFKGSIPSSIFNMSKITVLTLGMNQLSGSLPANIGLGLPNIQRLYTQANDLSGVIPNFSNASMLTHLQLHLNSFTGFIPSTLCALTNLECLNLYMNNLTIETSTLSCLANHGNLKRLLLAANPLNARLDDSFRNCSISSLQHIDLRGCSMKGIIPIDIGNSSSLIDLNLGYNQLTGSIPTSVERLRNLQGLYLNDNKLEGYIPYELCQLDNLGYLYLGGNQLTGSIPSCLGSLAGSLRTLSLESNLLSSTIPSTLWRLAYILHVNLSSNSLIGPLSQDIGNLKVVLEVDLSNNHLSGVIPSTIGGLLDLNILSLANNNLEGPIPSKFNHLLSLELLDISRNSLSGVIPSSLEALLHLKYLDLSFNRLQGQIPTGGPFQNFPAQSFISNRALCGAPRLHVPPCKNGTLEPNWRKAKYIIPGIISVILLVASASIFVLCRKRNVEVAREANSLPQLLWRRISHLDLLRATNGLDKNNLLGSGGFGSVYKGTLSDGTDVAVKVFNLQLEGAFKSFDRECEILSNIRHRNLIKIISCCSELDFKALVLNYMPNGSLEKWLYSENHSLNMLQRMNIMIDVASALEYLHHGNSVPIVHCDMKPSNILLDDDMVAHVADFGIAKLMGVGESTTQTMTLATIGYMAPGLTFNCSQICNAVAVASLLNATLVLPRFLYSNVWNDPSQFGDIYQGHFMDVLPSHLKSLDLEAIGSLITDADRVKEAKPIDYIRVVLPLPFPVVLMQSLK